MYGLIQVYADSDTVCLSNSGSASINYTIEGRSLEVREMQEPQEYAQSQVSETESRRLLHWKEYSDSIEVDIMYIFRKQGLRRSRSD